MKETNCDDQSQVLTELRQGRDSAFECIFRKVFGLFYKKIMPVEMADAKDLFYDTVARVLVVIGKDTEIRNIYGYVYLSALNSWQRWNKARTKVPVNFTNEDFTHIKTDFEMPAIKTVEELEEKDQMLRSMQQCLDQLDEKRRNLLHLLIVEKKSREEVANQLGFSDANTVGVIRNRALKAMKECMDRK